jgi:rod shape-determining protein MreD
MDEATPGIRPRPTLLRRLDATARLCVPAGSTALLLLLCAAPLGLPAQAELQPAIALACVFFWSLFRPASMPPAVVFLLGLLADLLGLGPPGVGALVLLIAHGLAFRWRHELSRQGFAIVWLAFVAIAAGAAALGWGLTSLLRFRLLPLLPAVFEWALAAGSYPALALGLTWAHRGIAAPERA